MSSQYMQSSNFLEAKPIPLISPPLSPLSPLSPNSFPETDLNNNSLEKGPKSLINNNIKNNNQGESPQRLLLLPEIMVTQEQDLTTNSSSTSSTSIPRNNKYRMRLCDIPPEILKLIKDSEEEKIKSNKVSTTAVTAGTTGELSVFSDIMGSTNDINSSSFATSDPSSSHNKGRVIITPNNNNITTTTTTTQITTHSNNNNKIISEKCNKRNRSRKNPYPKKAPSKSSPGITLKVDVFTLFKEDPTLLLKSDNPPNNSNSSSSFLLGDISSCEDSPPSPRPLSKRQRKTKSKRSKSHVSERKRKGNSLARVMADRGLLETTCNPVTATTGEIKPMRIPPPPPMQFDELVKSIDKLGLTTELLNKANPRINWKGQPLSISHLPHYSSLHPKEAIVASTLRLTPVQYLTAKHTLISSARRYTQKSLPFRKSDAQKLLRIDVNKASKLWEFFMHVKWI